MDTKRSAQSHQLHTPTLPHYRYSFSFERIAPSFACFEASVGVANVQWSFLIFPRQVGRLRFATCPCFSLQHRSYLNQKVNQKRSYSIHPQCSNFFMVIVLDERENRQHDDVRSMFSQQTHSHQNVINSLVRNDVPYYSDHYLIVHLHHYVPFWRDYYYNT